jgi:hypothetical protein
MSLTLDDPEIDRLLRRLTDLTGESIEVALREAVEERLRREERAAPRVIRRNDKGSLEEVLAIAKRVSSKRVIDSTPPDEMLYDEHGLPR